jgi:hypothetical protein
MSVTEHECNAYCREDLHAQVVWLRKDQQDDWEEIMREYCAETGLTYVTHSGTGEARIEHGLVDVDRPEGYADVRAHQVEGVLLTFEFDGEPPETERQRTEREDAQAVSELRALNGGDWQPFRLRGN